MQIKTAKIGLAIASDEALDRILARVNGGFTGGKITKSSLASWIVNYFERHAIEDNLERIRKDHFDQLAYLESVVKAMRLARRNGKDSEDISGLLSPLTGAIKLSPKKRSSSDSPNN